MQYKIINEQPWQILTDAMTISPSETGYELQVAADGKNYTTLFSVGPGITRQITNLSSGSYFRMKGNVGEVTVNWVRSCNSGGSGGGGNAGELEPVSEFPVGVPEGTVVALASGDTVGVYQYDGSEWIPVAGGDMSNYYTKAETNAAITAATEGLASEEYVDDAIEEALTGITLDDYWTSGETKSYVDEQVSGLTEYIEDVERVTATALTELHTDILALSAATPDMSNYYTKSEVDAEITGATDGFATEAYVDDAISGLTDMMETKEEVIASALVDLNTNKVGSTDVHTMVKLTQAQYDALTTKDPNTFYIIID